MPIDPIRYNRTILISNETEITCQIDSADRFRFITMDSVEPIALQVEVTLKNFEFET